MVCQVGDGKWFCLPEGPLTHSPYNPIKLTELMFVIIFEIQYDEDTYSLEHAVELSWQSLPDVSNSKAFQLCALLGCIIPN